MSVKGALWVISCKRITLKLPTLYPAGLYSLRGQTSYRKISWSLEDTRLRYRHFYSFWNLTGTSAAVLPRCLSISERYLSWGILGITSRWSMWTEGGGGLLLAVRSQLNAGSQLQAGGGRARGWGGWWEEPTLKLVDGFGINSVRV